MVELTCSVEVVVAETTKIHWSNQKKRYKQAQMPFYQIYVVVDFSLLTSFCPIVSMV